MELTYEVISGNTPCSIAEDRHFVSDKPSRLAVGAATAGIAETAVVADAGCPMHAPACDVVSITG
jgi:hypothetical protein